MFPRDRVYWIIYKIPIFCLLSNDPVPIYWIQICLLLLPVHTYLRTLPSIFYCVQPTLPRNISLLRNLEKSLHRLSKISSPSRKHAEKYPYRIQLSELRCGDGGEPCLGPEATPLVTIRKGEREYVTVREIPFLLN
jgi:hypothetical protein